MKLEEVTERFQIPEGMFRVICKDKSGEFFIVGNYEHRNEAIAVAVAKGNRKNGMDNGVDNEFYVLNSEKVYVY